jgi:hypothetical protein
VLSTWPYGVVRRQTWLHFQRRAPAARSYPLGEAAESGRAGGAGAALRGPVERNTEPGRQGSAFLREDLTS